MKKVIDGKLYDTETALEVHDDAASCPVGDFKFWEETLYKTKKGAWFICGRGGPMTKYARSCGLNAWTFGEGLRVLTDQEALSWLESHGADEDVIREHFLIEEA